MRSSSILDIIITANTFHTTPSNILGIDEQEAYLKYCIDDACAYLYNRIQPDKNGKQEMPIFDDDRANSKTNNPGLDLLLG